MYMRVESNNSRLLQHNKKSQREEWKRNRNEKEREKVTIRKRRRIITQRNQRRMERDNIEGYILSYSSDVLSSCWVM